MKKVYKKNIFKKEKNTSLGYNEDLWQTTSKAGEEDSMNVKCLA